MNNKYFQRNVEGMLADRNKKSYWTTLDSKHVPTLNLVLVNINVQSNHY